MTENILPLHMVLKTLHGKASDTTDYHLKFQYCYEDKLTKKFLHKKCPETKLKVEKTNNETT